MNTVVSGVVYYTIHNMKVKRRALKVYIGTGKTQPAADIFTVL